MLLAIHHIGIAVKNLDEATRTYVSALDAQVEGTHDLPDRGVRITFLALGNSKLELMESIEKDGPIAKFIESYGEGIHHICLEIDDINKQIESLIAKGVRLKDKDVRQGLIGKIALIHPEAMNGVLIELVEKEDGDILEKA